MRELEILRDRLLDMFERDPELKPRDVIVMTPDIGAYAPYITAVFDIPEGDGPVISYSIADQSTGRKNPIVQSFLSLLDMPDSRFGASRVLNLLGSAGIKERFGMTSAEVEIAARWVNDVNIRWGRDADNRQQKGLPGYNDNTWQAGTDRLLLGYAMRGQDQTMFSEILPYDHIEGGEAQVLGRFLEYLRRLFEWCDRLDTSRSPAAWQTHLTEMLENFIAIDEKTEKDIQYLHSCLETFGQLEKLAGYSEPLALKVVRLHLENHMDGSIGEGGFLSGGITFCAMLPMRSIPFKVVCLIGLDADAFPRDSHPLGFDLIARHPRAGDRSRRKDDKYLFLEALLSARRILYISYVGQSVQDNSHIPPSVLVSELIETVVTGFGVPEDALVFRHPLQAYSRRYFEEKESALFSYSKENLLAASGAGGTSVSPPFFDGPLSMPPEEYDILRLEHLCRFFTHPVRYLVRRRLRIQLDEPYQIPEDKENFTVDALVRYQMKQALLNAKLSGHDLSKYFPFLRAKGDLPQGHVGRVLYGQLEEEVEHFSEVLSEILGDEFADNVAVDMSVGKFSLLGLLDGLYRQGRIQVRFARRKAKDWLSVWIYHLVLCALKERNHPPVSTLFDTDGIVVFKPVDGSKNYLKKLLDTYHEGLRRPLHFFPELSLRYVQMVKFDGKEPGDALKTIRNLWVGNDFKKGISEDPYLKLCNGANNPIDEEFQLLAETLFIPILNHAEELIQ
jgi:exodeoxyribonuclease V gamma subunit